MITSTFLERFNCLPMALVLQLHVISMDCKCMHCLGPSCLCILVHTTHSMTLTANHSGPCSGLSVQCALMSLNNCCCYYFWKCIYSLYSLPNFTQLILPILQISASLAGFFLKQTFYCCSQLSQFSPIAPPAPPIHQSIPTMLSTNMDPLYVFPDQTLPVLSPVIPLPRPLITDTKYMNNSTSKTETKTFLPTSDQQQSFDLSNSWSLGSTYLSFIAFMSVVIV